MKKRIISAILSMAMVISTVTVLTSNALASLPVRSDSEEYQEKIKKYDEYYQRLSEKEIDYFYNVVADGYEFIGEENNITKVWVFNKSEDDTTFPYSRFDTYLFEYSLKDYFSVKFDLPIEDGEAICSELANALGYDSYCKIISCGTETGGNCAKIAIDFNTDNHELNYMIVEKALSILGEKYPIRDKKVQIDAVNYKLHLRLQSCLSYVYGNSLTGINRHEMTEEESQAFYNSIDHDYIKENFRAVYNAETGFIEFPDDYTQEEKLGCFSYFAENFDGYIHRYSEASVSEPISVEFSDEISYLNGDANRDKTTTIADAAAIMQAIGNPDKYVLSRQGEFNADSKGDGLTVDDAVAIQKRLAKVTE